MNKTKFIKEIEKSEGKERAKCGRWYIRVYGELDHKPMVELESLEIVVKELHKLEEENKNLKAIIEHYKKFEEGKERLEGMLKDIGEITSIKDGPITYRKDSTGKWVADGEPPYVLC